MSRRLPSQAKSSLTESQRIIRASGYNIQGERRGAAAADVRFVSEPKGCSPFAPPCWLCLMLLPTPAFVEDPSTNFLACFNYGLKGLSDLLLGSFVHNQRRLPAVLPAAKANLQAKS